MVASGAALLAQARPDLDARALRGALVGSAATVDGARRLDLGAAAAVEAIAAPASVPLGHANARGWQGAARFTVRNVSERPLGITVSTGELGEVGGAALTVSPARFRLAPREERKVSVVARMAYVPPGVRLSRPFELRAGGAAPIRVPWTLTLGRYERDLLGAVRLSTNRFRPSDSAPALLELRAGRLAEGPNGSEVLPLSYLDMELWRGRERVGRLARLRNLLPGRYTFGLTGRGPAGRRLAPASTRSACSAFHPEMGLQAGNSYSSRSSSAVVYSPGVTTVEAPSHLRENPFEIAQHQLRRVAREFQIDDNLVRVSSSARRPWPSRFRS